MTDIPLWNYMIHSFTGTVCDPQLIVHGIIDASSSSEAEERALLLLEGHIEDIYPTRSASAVPSLVPGVFNVDLLFQRA